MTGSPHRRHAGDIVGILPRPRHRGCRAWRRMATGGVPAPLALQWPRPQL